MDTPIAFAIQWLLPCEWALYGTRGFAKDIPLGFAMHWALPREWAQFITLVLPCNRPLYPYTFRLIDFINQIKQHEHWFKRWQNLTRPLFDGDWKFLSAAPWASYSLVLRHTHHPPNISDFVNPTSILKELTLIDFFVYLGVGLVEVDNLIWALSLSQY